MSRKRQEFSKDVKVEIIRRAIKDAVIYCEQCNCPTRRFEIHHLDMDAMQVQRRRTLTAKDGKLLCLPCHDIETALQMPILAKAKRIEAKELRAIRPKGTIKSRGFAPAKPRTPKAALKPRQLYKDMEK